MDTKVKLQLKQETEEVAYHMGWLTKAQLLAAAARYDHSPYGTHLRAVAEDKLVFERELHD